MKLKRLAVENFGPYHEAVAIDFPQDSSGNVLLVFGDNMRGKTSLLNAVRWCLYGSARDRQGYPLSLLKLVNRYGQEQGQWEMRVELDFEAAGKLYELRRQARPAERLVRPKSDDDFRTLPSLKINGDSVTADDITAEIARVCPEQISRFVLFDGELLQEYEALLIEESEQSRKIKAAIEQILGIPAIQNGLTDCRTLYRKAQAEQARQNKHTASLKAQAESQEALYKSRTQKEGERDRLAAQERETSSEISDLEQYLASVRAAEQRAERLRLLKDQLAIHEDVKKESEQERLATLRDAWRDLLQPCLRHKIAELEQEDQGFNRSLERRGALNEKIQQIRSFILGGRCPVCGEAPSGERRDTLGRDLASAEAELSGISLDTERRANVLQSLKLLRQIRRTGAAERLTQTERRTQKAEVGITEKASEIESLHREISDHDTGEIAQKRQLLNLKNQNLGVIRQKLSETERAIADLSGKIDQLSALLSQTEEGRHRRINVEVEAYRRLAEVFDSGVAKFRERMRGSVEAAASKIFRTLTTEPNYLGLQINEQYGLSILDTRRQVVPLRSAGAEQIVALSLIAGLNAVSGKDTPMIMDTPLGRLDAKHRRTVLAALPDMAGQVVLLVHDAEIGVKAGLEEIAPRVGGKLEIQRISETRSRIVKKEGLV